MSGWDNGIDAVSAIAAIASAVATYLAWRSSEASRATSEKSFAVARKAVFVRDIKSLR